MRATQQRPLRGVEVNGPDLTEVLFRWISMMEEPWEDDAPWWYNERASLSQLAGAIWLQRGWVFEEYSASKKHDTGHYPGRVDLMFECGDIKAVAEAKQIWPSLVTVKGYRRCVDEALRRAKKDASRAPNLNGQYQRLAMAFVTPVAPPRLVRDPEAYEKTLNSFVSELRRTPNATVAWVFPDERRTLRSRIRKYCYPGTAIVIR